MKRKNLIYFLLLAFFVYNGIECLAQTNNSGTVPSTKKERNRITDGNKEYNNGNYGEAIIFYEEALKENPQSVIARYNLGLSQLKIGNNPNDTTKTAKELLTSGLENMEKIASIGKNRPDLSSKANYNLGNVAYVHEDYRKAIDYYKQSLRLNPDNEDARRNLRLAQLKINDGKSDGGDEDQNDDQSQEQDQEKDQNQDQSQNEDQNNDQNQDEEQNQDQNQDQNQNEEESDQDFSEQTADQIRNAIENKENQTRARLGVGSNNQEKSKGGRNKNRLNW